MGRRESPRLSEWRRGNSRSSRTERVRESIGMKVLLQRILEELSKAWRDSEPIGDGNVADESARQDWLDSSVRIRIRRKLLYLLQREPFQKHISVH